MRHLIRVPTRQCYRCCRLEQLYISVLAPNMITVGQLTIGTTRDDTLEQVRDGRDSKFVLVGTVRSPWSPERLTRIA